MKTLGNLIWLVLCGVWTAIGWLLTAVLLAVTVVGIPFARQCVKLAHFTLWPFGRTVVRDESAVRGGAIGNVIWFLPGVLLAIGYAVAGVLMAVTVVGIPFALQAWKLIPLALSPFGKRVVLASEVRYAG